MELLLTPRKSSDTENLCSICLSPLFRRKLGSGLPVGDNSNSNSGCLNHCEMIAEKSIAETKCKVHFKNFQSFLIYNNILLQHQFHTSCLKDVKERRPECPLCRALLTPCTGSINRVFVENSTRMAIVQAASRGRNAVR